MIGFLAILIVIFKGSVAQNFIGLALT